VKRDAAIAGAGAALVLAVITIAVALLRGDDSPPPAPEPTPAAPKPGAPPYDAAAFQPFAYGAGAEHGFLARGSRGMAHVVYELSPGGVERSVARTTRWRDEVDDATAGSPIDPNYLEAMLFLESAGRPTVMADGTPASATGLMQIIPSTATALLGMHVDLARSLEINRELARQHRRAEIARKAKKRRAARREVHKLLRERKVVDERFDPRKSLAAAVRYLTIAGRQFGREDLAVASYHMGIGNLKTVIDAYVAPRARARTTWRTVKRYGLSWPRLYYDSSPTRNPRTWDLLTALGDDSRHYLFKVLASREILRLARNDPDELERQIELQTAKASAEEVLRPESRYPPYEDDKDLRFAYKRDELVPLPDAPKRLAFRPSRRMGSLARRLDQPKILYRGLRPEALATLLYIAKEYRHIAGHGTLRVTSTVRDLPYQDLLVETNIQATSEFSLHTTGFAIDIAKPRAESALRFLLERLQALDVIAWVEEPGAFHLTVGSEGEAFMPLYEALIEDQRPLVPHAPDVAMKLDHKEVEAGDTLQLTIENTGDRRLEYGVSYMLERRTDHGWRWINLDQAFVLVLQMLEAGETEHQEIDLPGDLQPDRYRIRKSFTGRPGEQKFRRAVEFRVS
jgi:soluble lytic murein transglycosylase-like protein